MKTINWMALPQDKIKIIVKGEEVPELNEELQAAFDDILEDALSAIATIIKLNKDEQR